MSTGAQGGDGPSLILYLLTATSGFVASNWATIAFVVFGAIHAYIAIQNYRDKRRDKRLQDRIEARRKK